LRSSQTGKPRRSTAKSQMTGVAWVKRQGDRLAHHLILDGGEKNCGRSESERGHSRSGIRLDTGPREIGVDLSGSSRSPISPQFRVRVAASILPHSETQRRRLIAKHIFGCRTHHLCSVFSEKQQPVRSSIDVGHKAWWGEVGKLPGRHDRAWLRICPGHLLAIFMNDQNRR
jgi:hypothetical protein